MREAKCSGCGADIMWLKTPRGKNMPVDLKGEQRVMLNDKGEAVVIRAYMPHWANCPKAKEFKK
jgi:hypothetical protein